MKDNEWVLVTRVYENVPVIHKWAHAPERSLCGRKIKNVTRLPYKHAKQFADLCKECERMLYGK